MKLKNAALFTLSLTLIAPEAFAQEGGRILNLFPKQRTSHQERMNENSAKIDERRQARLENLYTYQGEGGESLMGGGSQASATQMIPEEKLDAVLNSAATPEQVENSSAPTDAPPLPTDAQ